MVYLSHRQAGSGRSHRGQREESVDSEGFAGQWWSIPCSGATINYVTANSQATKGFPKIGGSCPRSENKWPKSQRERTVFLTCGHYGDARSAEMKHSVLWLWSWNRLFHQDTKRHRNVHASHARRPVYKEGKTRGMMACWPPEPRASLHLEKGKPQGSFLLIIAGIKVNLWWNYRFS